MFFISVILANISSRIKSFFACLIITLLILSVYGQVYNFDFINFDDDIYVTKNKSVNEGISLRSVIWAFTSFHAANWHPLSWISHMLDCQWYGLNSGAHHLTSLFFHILNSLLIFIVLKKTTHKFWQSAFVAALFAVHPLHVESVSWVSERKDVLSTFFFY